MAGHAPELPDRHTQKSPNPATQVLNTSRSDPPNPFNPPNPSNPRT
jgi:hypothetical protein